MHEKKSRKKGGLEIARAGEGRRGETGRPAVVGSCVVLCWCGAGRAGLGLVSKT